MKCNCIEIPSTSIFNKILLDKMFGTTLLNLKGQSAKRTMYEIRESKLIALEDLDLDHI